MMSVNAEKSQVQCSRHFFKVQEIGGRWFAVFSRSGMSDSLPPHGLQPTRLLCPWDSPGNNTGVGHHALLQGLFLA